MSFAKQFLFLIDEKTFVSQKNQKILTNVERFDNINIRDENRFFNRFNKKTYVFDKKNDFDEFDYTFEIDDNVYFNENLKYYNSNHFVDDKKKLVAHFVTSTSTSTSTSKIICR